MVSSKVITFSGILIGALGLILSIFETINWITQVTTIPEVIEERIFHIGYLILLYTISITYLSSIYYARRDFTKSFSCIFVASLISSIMFAVVILTLLVQSLNILINGEFEFNILQEYVICNIHLICLRPEIVIGIPSILVLVITYRKYLPKIIK